MHAGESSYLFVLENSRRLIEARLREREIAADEQRAQARIERAVGNACARRIGGTAVSDRARCACLSVRRCWLAACGREAPPRRSRAGCEGHRGGSGDRR